MRLRMAFVRESKTNTISSDTDEWNWHIRFTLLDYNCMILFRWNVAAWQILPIASLRQTMEYEELLNSISISLVTFHCDVPCTLPLVPI